MGGWGSIKGGSHKNSTIHDNDNLRHDIKSQGQVNIKENTKNNQTTNMNTNRIKWLKGASLSKVGMPHPRGA
jgi:hypothetical protein